MLDSYTFHIYQCFLLYTNLFPAEKQKVAPRGRIASGVCGPLGFNDLVLGFNDSIIGFNDSVWEYNDSVRLKIQ